MLTLAIMSSLALGLAGLLIFCDKQGKGAAFFDVQSTNSLRGFWSIIILLVHVPAEYQNTIQDLLGSFAYIGVTFFFMTSGYGLMLNIQKSPAISGKSFWTKRLPKLLVPMLLANILAVIVNVVTEQPFVWWQFVSITGFVRQLLLFYLVFFIIFRFLPDRVSVAAKGNIVSVCILAFSIIVYVFKNPMFAWPTESLGFAYGIQLAKHKGKVESFAKNNWWLKIGAAGGLALVLGISYVNFKQILFVGDYLNKIALGAAILAVLLIFSTKRPVSNCISRFLGKISYEVYLLHNTIFALIAAVYAELDSGLFILISIAATVLVSLMQKTVCDKLLAIQKATGR